MKRGAERQLTKDEFEEFEDGHVEPESTSDTGFKKAPDDILKTRVIRGLPNRTKPSGAQSNSTNGTSSSTPLSSSNQFVVAADEDDPVLFQYYINLRGLNHSLLNSISKGLEDDPFADMSGILESYKSTYLKIQKEKDDASTVSKPESSFGSSASKASSNFFSMPAASSPSPFGKLPTQGAASNSSTFKSSSNIFSMPMASSPSPFGMPPTQGATFKSNSSTSNSSSNSFSMPAASSPFGKPPAQGEASKPEPLSNLSTSKSPFNLFSMPAASSPFGKPPAQGADSKPEPLSNFSTTKPPSNLFSMPATSSPSSFGKPPTQGAQSSSGVHFQFGSGSSGIPQLEPKTAAAISTEEKAVDNATDGEGSEQATSATEGGESSGSTSNLLALHNPHDDEGEGEENEISVHAIKVKAYRMKKADAEGNPGWADLGFGILRLKKDKDTNARRILLRNSTNGKILINFKIYSGLKPSLVKKALTFVGHDNGVSQTYCVRLAGEEQAQQLKEALDQEIGSVAVKEE